jgi:hypothetical protein
LALGLCCYTEYWGKFLNRSEQTYKKTSRTSKTGVGYSTKCFNDFFLADLDHVMRSFILVEPGVIKTNIVNGMVIAKNSQNSNSPYSQIMQKMSTSFEQMLENASSPPDLVAKVVLQAVTSENPNLSRYLAGKDVETWVEAKRNMSDDEFYNMIKQLFS